MPGYSFPPPRASDSGAHRRCAPRSFPGASGALLGVGGYQTSCPPFRVSAGSFSSVSPMAFGWREFSILDFLISPLLSAPASDLLSLSLVLVSARFPLFSLPRCCFAPCYFLGWGGANGREHFTEIGNYIFVITRIKMGIGRSWLARLLSISVFSGDVLLCDIKPWVSCLLFPHVGVFFCGPFFRLCLFCQSRPLLFP